MGFVTAALGHLTPVTGFWAGTRFGANVPMTAARVPGHVLLEMSPAVSPENPSLAAKNQRPFFSPFRGLAHEKRLEATGKVCPAKTHIQRRGGSDVHPECGFQGDYMTRTQEAAESQHSSNTGSKPGLVFSGILPAKHWTCLLHINLVTSQ